MRNLHQSHYSLGNCIEVKAKVWMQRLHMVAAECGYKEIDRQLKEQFIHSLNDKDMLGEIIKELTTKNNDEQTTSEGVLVWAKREAQRHKLLF